MKQAVSREAIMLRLKSRIIALNGKHMPEQRQAVLVNIVLSGRKPLYDSNRHGKRPFFSQQNILK